ncbi:hypothetical protein nbrc107696_10440 [Gordonia spumicola]|uniref:Carrier domain-containing protein n=1 Tax=Gordonia spumicola TaxID=589161 RepID=A0A7I9V5A6_9ACTN|nr:phosphopantetheine-binding protein [Gordonia spumicola]GEE00598.1 hypothetical protein nbrc107696_10440 [Gordonia spumicola]
MLEKSQFIVDLVDILFVDPAELTSNTDLMDLGLTSISLARLVDIWRERGVQADFAALAENTSVRNWLTVLSA